MYTEEISSVLLDQLGGVHLERRASFRSVVMRDSISSPSILATVAVVALAGNVTRASRELIGWSNGLTEKAGRIRTGAAFALPTNWT